MAKKISVFRSADGEKRFNHAYQAVLNRWPVPYTELMIPTCMGDTHILASGSLDANPLMLLHPAGGGAAIWVRNVGPLSQHYRVYAIDTIGETNRSCLTRPFRIHGQRQQFADWMADIFDEIGIERADIVGNSFGGFLALNTALYFPDRIRKVVLISPAATFLPIPAWTWHFMPASGIGLLIHSERMLLAPYHWIWQDFPKDEWMARLRTMCALHGRPRHWSPTVFREEELGKIRTPILLLIGDHEVIYKPEDVIRRATRNVPGLIAEIIPNANHLAEYTASDRVNRRILEFLTD